MKVTHEITFTVCMLCEDTGFITGTKSKPICNICLEGKKHKHLKAYVKEIKQWKMEQEGWKSSMK